MRKELGKGKNILTTRRADKVYALKSICRISREAKKKVREEGEGREKKRWANGGLLFLVGAP